MRWAASNPTSSRLYIHGLKNGAISLIFSQNIIEGVDMKSITEYRRKNRQKNRLNSVNILVECRYFDENIEGDNQKNHRFLGECLLFLESNNKFWFFDDPRFHRVLIFIIFLKKILNLSFILNLYYHFILYYPFKLITFHIYFINLILKNYYHFTLIFLSF